jgi:hypothetical protein
MTTLDRLDLAKSSCNISAGYIDQTESSSLGRFYQKTKIGIPLILDFAEKL